MEKRELTCICCPLGCQITATIQNGEVDEVSGNSCPRGAAYARTELLHPMRIVTTTVPVIGGTSCRVSVKTRQEIPKDQIMDCIRQLRKVQAQAPVEIGDILLKNVAGTGIDIVATANVGMENQTL